MYNIQSINKTFFSFSEVWTSYHVPQPIHLIGKTHLVVHTKYIEFIKILNFDSIKKVKVPTFLEWSDSIKKVKVLKILEYELLQRVDNKGAEEPLPKELSLSSEYLTHTIKLFAECLICYRNNLLICSTN